MTTPKLTIVGADETNPDAEEVTPEVPVISEIKSYDDGEGRMVVGKYPINGTKPSFVGSFMVSTNRGPVRLPIEFDESFTLEECFEQFDAMAKATVEAAQKEASERQLIVTPGDLKNNGPIVT